MTAQCLNSTVLHMLYNTHFITLFCMLVNIQCIEQSNVRSEDVVTRLQPVLLKDSLSRYEDSSFTTDALCTLHHSL